MSQILKVSVSVSVLEGVVSVLNGQISVSVSDDEAETPSLESGDLSEPLKLLSVKNKTTILMLNVQTHMLIKISPKNECGDGYQMNV